MIVLKSKCSIITPCILLAKIQRVHKHLNIPLLDFGHFLYYDANLIVVLPQHSLSLSLIYLSKTTVQLVRMGPLAIVLSSTFRTVVCCMATIRKLLVILSDYFWPQVKVNYITVYVVINFMANWCFCVIT